MRHQLTLLKTFYLILLLIPAVDAGIAHAQDTHPLETRADSLIADLDRIQADFDALEARYAGSTGKDSVVTYRQMIDTGMAFLDRVHELAGVVVEQEEAGVATTDDRDHLSGILERIPQALRDAAAEVSIQLEDTRSRAQTAAPGELPLIEGEISELEDRLGDLFEIAGRHIQTLERLEMEDPELREELTGDLTSRADLTAGRLRLSIEERDKFEDQARQYPDEAEFRQRADAAAVSVDSGVASLERTVTVMDELGMDVTEYRTLLVEATGELSRGLGDSKVAVSLIQRWFEKGREWVADQGPNVTVKFLVFLAILLAFRVLSRFIKTGVRRSIDSSKLEPSQLLKNMIVNVSGNVVMIFGFLIALSQLGISLGPLLAGVGVVGFILGFALQDTLANFAAGLMVLFYKPYDVGDMVEAAGVMGKVSDMSLVSTTILTVDNQTLIVPNGKIWGDVIRNVTAQNIRRVDMVFGIGYSDDIPHAEKVMMAILEEHPKVLKEPEPIVKLFELADSSVNFVVRPWARTEDYWDVLWDVTREVKLRFDKEGIGIPFPQRDVHLFQERVKE